MFVYEFDFKRSFFVADGDVSIKVNNGRLELADKPDPATARLIADCGGRLVEPEAPRPAAKKVKEG